MYFSLNFHRANESRMVVRAHTLQQDEESDEARAVRLQDHALSQPRPSVGLEAGCCGAAGRAPAEQGGQRRRCVTAVKAPFAASWQCSRLWWVIDRRRLFSIIASSCRSHAPPAPPTTQIHWSERWFSRLFLYVPAAPA